ncbi:MAG TPA: hypothetical protein VK152_00020 [Paludibacter sp.]|nr:hypothetical protein [Paludibacter sp.]
MANGGSGVGSHGPQRHSKKTWLGWHPPEPNIRHESPATRFLLSSEKKLSLQLNRFQFYAKTTVTTEATTKIIAGTDPGDKNARSTYP